MYWVFAAHGYATDTVSWIFKLLYATESVMNDSSDPRYAGICSTYFLV